MSYRVLPVSTLSRRLFRAYLSREFVGFLFFGGVAALVNLVVGMLLYGDVLTPRINYWSSVFIGASFGLVVNFSLNYAFNFKFQGRSAFDQFRTFIVVAVIGTLLTASLASLFLWLIVISGVDEKILGLSFSSRFLAHFCAIGVVTLYSFAAHKYFSFNVGIRMRLFGRK